MHVCICTYIYIFVCVYVHYIHTHTHKYVVFQGHFVKNLGSAGDKETETEVLLLEHDVPHQPFSQAVLSFLPKMPWSITEKVMDFNYYNNHCAFSFKSNTVTFSGICVF